MQAKEFKEWRINIDITQDNAADKFGVTRVTIQNWENGNSPIPKSVEKSCEIYEREIKQNRPDFGPVTLIYSDGSPCNPNGLRRLPMMQTELYPTNADALKRVCELWDGDRFHNPFIVEATGITLWNSLELQRVIKGKKRRKIS